MTGYRINKVLEADYKPGDGEPFCVAWGADGWVIWCRIPVIPRIAKKKVKRKKAGDSSDR